jgi:integrase
MTTKKAIKEATATDEGAEPTPGRGGRKSKEEQRARPYTIFTRGAGKVYYMSYTGWRQDLKRKGTIEKSLGTKIERVATRKADGEWQLILKREIMREDRDSELLDPCFAEVLAAWSKQELARPISTGHKQAIKGAVVYLLSTSLKSVDDMGTLTAKKVRLAAKELRAACTIMENNKPTLQAPTYVKLCKFLARVGDFAVENDIPCINLRPMLLRARVGLKDSRRRTASDLFDPIEIDLIQRASDTMAPRTNGMGNKEKLSIQTDLLCRKGEVCLLRPKDIDFAKNIIRMPTLKHYHNSEWFEKHTPQDVDRLESRDLPMTPRVRALMEDYFAEGGADPIGRRWQWLFPAYRNQEKVVGADGKFRIVYLKEAVTWKSDPALHRPMVSGGGNYLKRVIREVERLFGVVIEWRDGEHIFRHTAASTMYKMVKLVEMSNGRCKEVRGYELEEIKAMAGHVTEDGQGGRGYSSETLEKHYLRYAAGVPSLEIDVLDWHKIANILREARAKKAEENNRKMPEYMSETQVPLGSTPEYREEAKLAAA